MATFNGHRSWNSWNISLWINNDEPLYRTARSFAVVHRGDRREAARAMLSWLRGNGVVETPDGAPYTVTSIKEAMREIV